MKDTKPASLDCLVVDDEEIAVEGIVSYIGRVPFLRVAATASSALEAAEVLKEKPVSLMFLDINMPHLFGTDFLESLGDPPMTILTTAYSEYALEGYRLNVVDYLLKPVSFRRFFQAVTKAQDLYTAHLLLRDQNREEKTYVRLGDAFKRIEWKDILYAESMQNYVKLHFRNDTLVIHQTMSALEEMLPAHAFFRIHRSWLINLYQIDSVSGNRVFINGRELPVAAQRMREFLQTVVYGKLLSR